MHAHCEARLRLLHRSDDFVRAENPQPHQRFSPANGSHVDVGITESSVQVGEDLLGDAEQEVLSTAQIP